MAKFSEMPPIVQVGVLTVLILAGSVGYYYYSLKPQADINAKDTITLDQKRAEVAQLEPYEYKSKELLNEIAQLNEQLERQKRIVPDEQEVPGFLILMQTQAVRSGVKIRKYVPKASVKHDYYTELPFDIAIDGPYYKVLDFFQKLSQSERIVDIYGLHMTEATKGGSGYEFLPGTSVVATCEARTFYSSPAGAPPAPGRR
jgi:type IV pilus assembly protein PilO